MGYIGLMDCNNFFVSCERLFRPDLLGKPVAVLSSNDGCIVARSNEVKQLGIAMGTPYFQVQDACTKGNVTIFSSNFPLYRDISARVMEVLRQEVGTCEVYSVDEAFFELSETITFDELKTLRDRVMQKTGIPISFGIGSTKTIAKAASTLAKKQEGVEIVSQEVSQDLIGAFPCGAVWGIGRKMAMKLANDGINTVSDLISKDLDYIRERHGVVGERIYFELTGTSVNGLSAKKEAPQSISSTRSFRTETHDLGVLESAITYHTENVSRKIREQRLFTTSIRVIAAPSRFSDCALRQTSLKASFASPTNDSAIILKKAVELISVLFDSEIPYKKAGVCLEGVIPEEYVAKNLFDPLCTGDSISTVRDKINTQFGHLTVYSGTMRDTISWQSSLSMRSREYTTKWNQIASANAI